jgi:hypothetical protein
MTDADYAEKLDKLERLLNDPDVPMRPALIWRLLDEVSKHNAGTVPLMMLGEQSRSTTR